MKKMIFMLSVVLVAVTGCAQRNDVEKETNETIAATDNPTIKRVSKTEFQTYLDESETVQLIDVRTSSEFESGHIDGSKNIDFNNQEFENSIKQLDKNTPVLIYCRSGGRSAKALKIFEANGFTTVLELEGGYLNWIK